MPATGPGWTLAIIEMLHTTCIAAFAACVRARAGTIRKKRGGGGVAFEVAWVCRFDRVCSRVCVNLGEQNPIYRAASLFHSCLTTHAHTQRKCK